MGGSIRYFKDKGRDPLVEATYRADLYEKRSEKWHPGNGGPWKYTPREEFIKREVKHIKHNRMLRKKWPKGAKSKLVLEFIKNSPKGKTEAEIRQFVWEMNGYKGPAKKYYWMGFLKYEAENHKLPLLLGWCDYDEVSKRWSLKKGMKIEPPYLRRDTGRYITAKEYRERVGHDPRIDGLRLHYSGTQECMCPIPDNHEFYWESVPEQYHHLFEFNKKFRSYRSYLIDLKASKEQ